MRLLMTCSTTSLRMPLKKCQQEDAIKDFASINLDTKIEWNKPRKISIITV